jgi:lysophospholipase L1-like esterase
MAEASKAPKVPEAADGEKPRRALGKKILLLACAVVVGLALGEALLRLAGISYPQLYAPDPHCASRLRPGVRGWWISEGRGFVQINRDGLRDEEHPLEKPADTIRIAVLGDSYTEALQVDARDAYSGVAERALRRRAPAGGRRIEFINFGVSGYGTAQELLMLRNYVWRYDPDVVLVAFCHNDIEDNSRELGGGPARPYFVLEGDELRLDNSFRQSEQYRTALTPYEQRKAWLVNRSYLLQVLKRAKWNWRLRREQVRASERVVADAASDFNFYAPPETEARRVAWELTERLLVEFTSEADMRKAKFGLITVTTPLQTHPDAHLRAAAAERAGARDLFYAEKRLEALAERHGFPILTLGAPLQNYAESHNVFLHGFANTELGTGHWNVQGHRAAGELLAAWLAAEVLD